MRRNNWRAKNLCICANFNMTNVEEIFEEIASKGQHPRMVSDTYILLEQLGHRLDRESERNFVEAQKMGLEGTEITKYIEDHINVANIQTGSADLGRRVRAVWRHWQRRNVYASRPVGHPPCFLV